MDKLKKRVVAKRFGSKTGKLKKKHPNRLKEATMKMTGVSEEKYYELKRAGKIV